MDLVRAHKWLALAEQFGHQGVAKLREDVETKLKPNELLRAQQMAEEFKAAPVVEEFTAPGPVRPRETAGP